MSNQTHSLIFKFRERSQKNHDYSRKIYLLLRNDFYDFQKSIQDGIDLNLDPHLVNFLSDVYCKLSEITDTAKAYSDQYQDEIFHFDKVISDYQEN